MDTLNHLFLAAFLAFFWLLLCSCDNEQVTLHLNSTQNHTTEINQFTCTVNFTKNTKLYNFNFSLNYNDEMLAFFNASGMINFELFVF